MTTDRLPGFTPSDGAEVPDPRPYRAALDAEWQRLVTSGEVQRECVAQKFLERHPSLIPGANGGALNNGHWPWPGAVITQPRLTGLAERHPDFMWIGSDSVNLRPVLVEIERPDKKWFKSVGENRFGTHGEFTEASDQITDWHQWFSDHANVGQFIRDYKIPRGVAELPVRVSYVIIHGLRSEFGEDIRKYKRRGALSRADINLQLLTFDSLRPDANAFKYGTVKIAPSERFRAVTAPALMEIDDAWPSMLEITDGWEDTIQQSSDIGATRKTQLLDDLKRVLDQRPTKMGLRHPVPRKARSV